MIHHPQKEIIEKYTVGELSAQLALMISAHLDQCEECRSRDSKILERESLQMASTPSKLSNHELDSAFLSIMSKVSAHDENSKNEADSQGVSIQVSGQLIPLPRSLNFLKDRQIPWKEFGKKNAIAPIAVTPKGNFYLIYIGPGESVPQHNHSGTEYSYVVAGSYDDGISVFNTGDFSFSTHETTHSPRATSDDGCLVISWVEGRLNYFDGLLKPLNSILWWYLHRA
jgi:putative transcriptional regulator